MGSLIRIQKICASFFRVSRLLLCMPPEGVGTHAKSKETDDEYAHTATPQ
jgi:hypothetical protein